MLGGDVGVSMAIARDESDAVADDDGGWSCFSCIFCCFSCTFMDFSMGSEVFPDSIHTLPIDVTRAQVKACPQHTRLQRPHARASLVFQGFVRDLRSKRDNLVTA